MPHDTRDQILDFVRSWVDKTDMPVTRFMPWIGIGRSKYQDWIERFGKVNEHNACVPRDSSGITARINVKKRQARKRSGPGSQTNETASAGVN